MTEKASKPAPAAQPEVTAKPVAKPAAKPAAAKAKLSVPAGIKTPAVAKSAKAAKPAVPSAAVAAPAVVKADVASEVAPQTVAPKAAKVVKPAKVKVEKVEKEEKADKPKKAKMVRDSFTMPDDEYTALSALKKRLLDQGVAAKKSELLRAGVALLVALDDAALKTAVEKVEVIKTGRPAKSGK